MTRGDDDEWKIMHEFHASYKTDLKGLIKLYITHTQKKDKICDWKNERKGIKGWKK